MTRGNLQVSSRSRRNKKVKPKKIGLEKWQLRPKRLKGTSIKFIIKAAMVSASIFDWYFTHLFSVKQSKNQLIPYPSNQNS